MSRNVAAPRRATTEALAPKPRFTLGAVTVWASIVGFVALVAGMLAVQAGGLLMYVYPLAAVAVAALLYRHSPALYLGFTWWLWFLTPEVRRLVDYQQHFFSSQNPVMLAPYLVAAITGFALLRHLPKLQLHRYLPFGLILLGLFYAYGIGVYINGTRSATYDLLNWAVPVVFAFYLAVHWRTYPDCRRVTQRTFAWGILIMGLYGLLQYFTLPEWDRYWMESAPISSIGSPEPLQVRVFGTLNAPGPFAQVMMAGLLVIFSGGGPVRWFAAAPGYASFVLSLVRGAWGAWVIGLTYMLSRRGRSSFRLMGATIVMALISWPLLTFGPVADTVNARLETITDLEQDQSFNSRLSFYAEFAPTAFLNLEGEGLGSTGLATKLSAEDDEQGGYSFDSGLMNIPFVLGWPGSFLYVSGFVWLLYHALRGKASRSDLFAATSGGIVVAMLVQLVFANSLNGISGMILWTFLGFLLMAGSYDAAVIVGPRQQTRVVSKGRLAGTGR